MKKTIYLAGSAAICVCLVSSFYLAHAKCRNSEQEISHNIIKLASTNSNDDSDALKKAINKAKAGDTIMLTSPTYKFKSPIELDRDGKNSGTIKLIGSSKDKVKLDFSEEAEENNAYGINLKGSYWDIENIEVYHAGDNGILLKGTESHNNTIKNCITDSNDDSGLQITDGAYDNLVQDCSSFDNYDITTKGSNADGFACKLGAGAGNKFINCNSYNNSDDGFDLLGTDNTVTLTNCTSTRNGYYHGDPSNTLNNSEMNGDGFKLGGNQKPPKGTHRSKGSHVLYGCKAYDNKGCGFSQNNSAGSLALTDCTADRNGVDNNLLIIDGHSTKANFNFPYNPGKKHKFTFKNCTTEGYCCIYSGAKVIGGNLKAVYPDKPLPNMQ